MFLAAWTEFQSEGCSATCGSGTERLTRVCVGAGQCEGNDFFEQPCKNLPVCGKSAVFCKRIYFREIDQYRQKTFETILPDMHFPHMFRCCL